MPKPSTINRLPPDILEQLQALLRDPRVTQLEATHRINEILEQDGHPERVSKSAVNRYAVRMEEVGARLRQSREIASMWIGKLGATPQGEVGHLLNEIIRTLAFDAAMKLAEDEEPAPPEMLKDLSLTLARLERAAVWATEREDEIRRQEKERLAEELARVVKEQGQDGDSRSMVERIRTEVFGFVD